jgi:hypothetical protein
MSRAEISRIHAKGITDLAVLKKTSDFRTRFTVFLAIAVIALLVAQTYRRDFALILLVSCTAVIFLTARLDVVRLRWLLAEVLGGGPPLLRCPGRFVRGGSRL